MKILTILSIYNSERGVTAILVAILLVVFIGFAALALDLSHIFVAQNELHNAADAGALAGARFLYNDDGTLVNEGANQIAFKAAVANFSEKVPVEMLAYGVVYAKDGDVYPVQQVGDDENDLDVVRGHWSFGLSDELPRGFTANASLEPADLWGVSDEDLDKNTNFINAVQVTTRRTTLSKGTPITSFFARIFGYENFQRTTTAVAYIGFAGTLEPGDADVPIAICQQSVTDNPSATECGDFEKYDCNIGYMLSDGQEKNTAAWTNFSQPCDTADTGDLRDLLTCSEANPDPISLGDSIGATNGVVDAVIGHPNNNNLVDCWKNGKYWNDENEDGLIDTGEMQSIDTDGDGMPDMPWNLTLPVVNCPALHVSNCMETCGAVNVNVVWILEKENDIDADAPYKMADWDFNALTPEQQDYNNDGTINGIDRWNSFVTHPSFNLQKINSEGNFEPATVENDGFKKKSIYFLPDCTPHALKGTSGGHNYGILARIPVLVK